MIAMTTSNSMSVKPQWEALRAWLIRRSPATLSVCTANAAVRRSVFKDDRERTRGGFIDPRELTMTTSAGPRSWAGLTILLFAAVVAAGGCSSGPTDSSVSEPRGGGHAVGTMPSSGNNELGATTKVVAANVTAAAPYKTNFRRSLVVKAGDVALGVTAVIDPAALDKLADPDIKTLLAAIQPPDEVLPNVLAKLESESDYQVLSVEGPFDLARRLAEAYPSFDVVLSLPRASR
jgi:hypothetical protein